MFKDSKFLGLPEKEFVDEETYSSWIPLLNGEEYMKTRVCMNVPLTSKNIYSIEITRINDAYMDISVPDPFRNILKIELVVNELTIETFDWNEEKRSWISGFNDKCPLFSVGMMFTTSFIKIYPYRLLLQHQSFRHDIKEFLCLYFETDTNNFYKKLSGIIANKQKYNVEMTKINFTLSIRREISCTQNLSTVLKGKELRYLGGCVYALPLRV